MAKHNVLLVAAEAAPLAQVGGVAEYVLGLGCALRRRGHDVRIALPGYGYLLKDARPTLDRLVIDLGVGATQIGKVYEASASVPGEAGMRLPVYLFTGHPHFASAPDASAIYCWPNHEPWIVFNRAVVDFFCGPRMSWRPDVLHGHDAHASVLPAYIKHLRAARPNAPVARAKTVLTIHNLLTQGLGEPGLVAYAGLPWSFYTVDTFEYYGRTNCLKGGLIAADAINTVSRSYASEICASSSYGFGLEGVLRGLQVDGKLRGIVNGLDENRWRVPGLKYDGSDSVEALFAARKTARKALFTEWMWKEDSTPVLSVRSRWDEQKGARLLAEGIPELLESARCVIVTWGTPGMTPDLRRSWRELNRLAEAHPDRLVINPSQLAGVDKSALHYMMSDLFLMPSRYEPCGLVQMECQRFGVIPIVRRTGGLADTVSETETDLFPSPNGFLFDDFRTPHEMIKTCRRACAAFNDRKAFDALVRNALLQKNGWDTRVEQYEELYQ